MIAVALAVALAVEVSSGSYVKFVDVGNQTSPEVVFFGTEYHSQDLSRYGVRSRFCGSFSSSCTGLVGPARSWGAFTRSSNRVTGLHLKYHGQHRGHTSVWCLFMVRVAPSGGFLLVVLGLSYFYFVRRGVNGLANWGGPLY